VDEPVSLLEMAAAALHCSAFLQCIWWTLCSGCAVAYDRS